MKTNVASFFFMTQQVIPQMKKQNSGHVVDIPWRGWVKSPTSSTRCSISRTPRS
jgi:NADP-dependent 3-hydroxy acid dehydrogenase YdfG